MLDFDVAAVLRHPALILLVVSAFVAFEVWHYRRAR